MHLWSKMLYTIEICTIDPQTMKLLIFIFYFFRCLILRVNGELSQLDLVDGLERELTDSIELFWVTNGLSDEKSNLIEKVSWLDYGHKVMQVKFASANTFSFQVLSLFYLSDSSLQVCYPSPGVDPFKQEDFLQTLKWNLTVRYTLLVFFQLPELLLVFS
ncbi:uncharacterized protein LOC131301726 isoform X3 [Rhododendron vialii]|uniref:uncharacterized protein LOC131301726 isoform X3 n=1 Tax=Rhododendron vialii TaxID=182163 RepID=UPI0026602FBF|nr:uncharacterized protein LOC131301726 isoform X3 [Rhododendron vialii]